MRMRSVLLLLSRAARAALGRERRRPPGRPRRAGPRAAPATRVRRARCRRPSPARAADDTVRVASGTYDLASTLEATAGGLAIEAESVEAPPLLQWSGSPDGSAVTLSGAGQTLRGLRITGALDAAARPRARRRAGAERDARAPAGARQR